MEQLILTKPNFVILKQDLLVKTIVFMFLLFIPIDMVNGILLSNGFISIAIPYKLLTLILVVGYLLQQKDFIYSNFILIAAPILFSGVVFYALYYSNYNSAKDDLFIQRKLC